MSILIIQRGSLFHWENYEFEDNSKKNKYFIALNCKIQDSEINLVLPTSKIELQRND